KPAQPIALTAAKPLSHTPAVVLAPAHVKLNWQDEWEKFTRFDGQCEVLFGRTPRPLDPHTMVYVLNHHILVAWINELTRIKPRMLIVDEAHNFVSHGTKTYPLVQRLARAAGRVLLLTGTPLVNKLEDVWSLCNLVCPALLGTKGAFEEIFIPEAKATKAAYARARWTAPFMRKRLFAEASKMKHPKPVRDRLTAELGALLRSTVMKRRVWKDVGVQMPDVIDQTVWLPVDDKAFWAAEEEIKEAYKANPYELDGEKFKAFAAGRANAARHKLDAVQEWLNDFLNETEDEKIVICGWSVAPLTELHGKFKKRSVLVNGTLTAEEKHRRTNAFQTNPDIRILFGNIKSIGTGINLTAASVMGFLELPLTDADYVQCRSRLQRLSMTAKSLRYYEFLIKDSFEHQVVKRIILRKKCAGKLLLEGQT
ncbi:MAG: SNF2-related protein, partial [Kiritimatiellaeota bacterium]|nr:SNF2-related protein [Kiritimatiellota bacterium]